jgi:hypothetical protein
MRIDLGGGSPEEAGLRGETAPANSDTLNLAVLIERELPRAKHRPSLRFPRRTSFCHLVSSQGSSEPLQVRRVTESLLAVIESVAQS